MVQQGYPKEFAAGVICNAGTLGILIPPSIVMVVYAAATEVSVGRMFMAGVIPGVGMGLMLMVAIYIAARFKNLPAQEFVGFKELGALGGQRFGRTVAGGDHHGRHLWGYLYPDRGRGGIGSLCYVGGRVFLPGYGTYQGCTLG